MNIVHLLKVYLLSQTRMFHTKIISNTVTFFVFGVAKKY